MAERRAAEPLALAPAHGVAAGALLVPHASRLRPSRLGTLPIATRWTPGDGRLDALLQPPPAVMIGGDGPLSWPGALRPFQIDGVAALVDRPALLLADDMGLGKTVQAAAALRVLWLTGRLRRGLVVAPVSLLMQWRRELAAWAPELEVILVRGPAGERRRLWRVEAAVHLAGYETIRGDRPPLEATWDVLILDEASRIKNPYAAISTACKRLKAHRRWAMTGTPLENCEGDVISILRFLDPDGPPLAEQAPALLRARLAATQLRRRKSEVLPELPPKQVIELPLELTGGQRQAYDRLHTEGRLALSRLGDALQVSTILEWILRLKQLCNHDPVSGGAVKMDDLAWRLRQISAAGHRALVFSQFVDARFGIAQLERRLADLDPLCYSGQLSPRERERVAEQFRRDERHRVLLLSLRAGGLGLNLQVASYVFHLDRWWNPATENQAEDRAHRLGQHQPVTVYRYLCLETIEHRIDELIRAKRMLFDDLIEPVSLDAARFTKAEWLSLLS